MNNKIIPRCRIKSLMTRSSDVEKLSKESVHVVAAAAEIFLDQLVKTVAKTVENEIEYKDIAEIVNTQEKYCFLREMIPRKISIKQWKLLMAEKTQESETSSMGSNQDEIPDEVSDGYGDEAASGTGSEQYDADDDSSRNSQ